jgi:hypothetical protein
VSDVELVEVSKASLRLPPGRGCWFCFKPKSAVKHLIERTPERPELCPAICDECIASAHLLICEQEQRDEQADLVKRSKDHPPTIECPIDECNVCAVRDCVKQAPEHYWKDGCPACSTMRPALSSATLPERSRT